MSKSIGLFAEEAPARQAPVPAPPIKPLVVRRRVQQAYPCKGREHEVRRLILDLAELAATCHGRKA